MRHHRQRLWTVLKIQFVFLLVAIFSYATYTSAHREIGKSAGASSAKIKKSRPDLAATDFPYFVSRNKTLFDELTGKGFSPRDVHEIVKAAQPHKDLNRIRPGLSYLLSNSHSPIDQANEIIFKYSETKFLLLENTAQQWTAQMVEKEPVKRVITFEGDVNESLWNSAVRADMDADLIVELTEIFAWQIDFAREVRSGDSWKLSVEEFLLNGRRVGWGDILAAEYTNEKETYKAYLFRKNGEKVGYFDHNGENLRRMFLKSPVKFGRISSRFQRKRFHPILKRNRPHLGVDYAAPTGTPIRSVGSGVITFAGRNGGAGNMIKVRHNSVYKTAYKHLNRFARGIRRGQKIKTGQVIGYVGSTGLSTGPHLHFEFFKYGRFKDPLKVKFPPADPVPKSDQQLFAQTVRKLDQTMNSVLFFPVPTLDRLAMIQAPAPEQTPSSQLETM